MKTFTKKYTINDIACLAGVSRGTVSRVINNAPNVNPRTRKNILRIIKQKEYFPNPYARALITQKTNLIGLLIPDISNFFFADVIRGIQTIADEHNYDLILCTTEGRYQKEQEVLKRLQLRKVDGLVIAAMELTNRKKGKVLLNRLSREGQKIISISPAIEDILADYIVVDNEKGAYLATRHLIDLGYQKIAHISGPLKIQSAQERLTGYRKALEEANIPFDKNFVVDGEFAFWGGYKAVKELFSRKLPPTAIFAANDIMAIGALQALNESGQKVPEDVTLVGFDDMPISSLVKPALSTIRQPRFELGRKSAEILLGRIRNELPEEKIRITIEPKLVVRDSSAVYRKGES